MKPRRFRTKSLNEVYQAFVELWLAGPQSWDSELFLKDGTPRKHGSNGRIAFWKGFDGEPDVIVRGSLAQAARCAGKDCAKESRRRAREETK